MSVKFIYWLGVSLLILGCIGMVIAIAGSGYELWQQVGACGAWETQ